MYDIVVVLVVAVLVVVVLVKSDNIHTYIPTYIYVYACINTYIHITSENTIPPSLSLSTLRYPPLP